MGETTVVSFESKRRAVFRELNALHVSLLGDARWRMYADAYWSGYMNCFDERSPHTVTSEGDLVRYFKATLAYLDMYVERFLSGQGAGARDHREGKG